MSEHAFKVSITSMHTWSQMVTPALMMFRSKSKQVCIKHFCRLSMSRIFVSYMLCSITPQNVRHMMILVHFDEAMIHLMQFSLVISRCNITFSVFWLSQGSVATLTRWGGWSSYCHMCHSFLNLSVKTVLKSVDFWQIQTKITWLVFHGPRCTSTTSPNIITHSLTRIHIQKYFLKISIYGCPIGQAITFCSCGFFFFFRLFSVVADWISAILQHMVWP